MKIKFISLILLIALLSTILCSCEVLKFTNHMLDILGPGIIKILYGNDNNSTNNNTNTDTNTKCYIMYDANGGTGSMNPTIGANNQLVYLSPNKFIREGCSFIGWSTSPYGSVNFIDESEIKITSYNLTLYAIWQANKYFIQFNESENYDITIMRTSSMYGGATLGEIKSDTLVFYGDELEITYTPKAGFSIISTGETHITVKGDITSEMIFAVTEAIED